ncbi:ATP-binding protein [Streptomyces nitrosporeus]|uniref:ATP-binding protein n=1 Tax=Streptomyces nitrosporeus TaxID=28894 RepID=A0A5J6FCU0_9ACTN|nr:ATP-binding protein [Streptomyces nitrosporeus]QEU74218.1 ATP-binding protein [Streptomyces nitrosporeus]GGY97239.1 hypothetical protein GCM10010327_29950 [Streptomyces nitrosporeus]
MLNEEQTFVFPAVESCVAEARKRVRRVVRGWGFTEEFSDTAELLASELVTNAVLHASGGDSCRVVCALVGDLLTVSVIDHGSGMPVLRQERTAGTATGGRGLLLVESLACDWGVRPVLRGKATYFVLSGSREAAGVPRAAGEAGVREGVGGGTGDGSRSGCAPGEVRAGRLLPAARPGRPGQRCSSLRG